MALWQIGFVAFALTASVLCLLVCGLMLRQAFRLRLMTGGMLASCRKHRHDCKRFSDEARAAAKLTGNELLPFSRV